MGNGKMKILRLDDEQSSLKSLFELKSSHDASVMLIFTSNTTLAFNDQVVIQLVAKNEEILGECVVSIHDLRKVLNFLQELSN